MTHLQTALDLVRNGYFMLPLVARGKEPIAELVPRGCLNATRDETTTRAWWEAEPRANIGINLKMSGVLDIAPDSPERLEHFRVKGLPGTVRYCSGGDGHEQYLYRLPE